MSDRTTPRRLRRLLRSLFWASSAGVAWTWAFYPALVFAGARLSRRAAPSAPVGLTSVSVVLVVHNEEAVIRKAVEDLLALEYDPDKIEFIVVADGCTDRTVELALEFDDPRIRVYPSARAGLTAGVAYGVSAARNDVIVRTDADTRHNPDYLRCLMRHYADPKIGCVGGRFSFANVGETGITRNEGMYWKFEMLLRKAESDLGILSTTSGAVMSFRRSLFEEFAPTYSEDVVIPKIVVKKGYRVAQEPAAVAYELMPQSIGGEFRARKRMVSRGLTGVLSMEGGLSPLSHPGHWFSIVSHKLLRWSTPFLMIGSFVGALGAGGRPVYRIAAAAHAALYLSALAGYWMERRERHFRPFSAAFSFCLANLGFMVGVVEALRGRRVSAYRSEE